MAVMSIERELRDGFKLAAYEARSYLNILKGNRSPKDIAKRANVPFSRVYDVLRSLEEKGFIVKKGDGFEPVAPRVALKGRLNQFEAAFRADQAGRLKSFQSILSSLEKIAVNPPRRPSETVLLNGIASIINKFSEILAESEDVILIGHKALEAKELFKPLLKQSERKPQRMRFIVPTGEPLAGEDLAFAKKVGLEVRCSDNILLDLMVADKRDVIIGVPDPLSEEVYHAIAVFIRNPSFASSIRDSLEDLWSSSEPA